MATYGIYSKRSGAAPVKLCGVGSVVLSDVIVRGLNAEESNLYAKYPYGCSSLYWFRLIPPPNPYRDLAKMVEANGAA